MVSNSIISDMTFSLYRSFDYNSPLLFGKALKDMKERFKQNYISYLNKEETKLTSFFNKVDESLRLVGRPELNGDETRFIQNCYAEIEKELYSVFLVDSLPYISSEIRSGKGPGTIIKSLGLNPRQKIEEKPAINYVLEKLMYGEADIDAEDAIKLLGKKPIALKTLKCIKFPNLLVGKGETAEIKGGDYTQEEDEEGDSIDKYSFVVEWIKGTDTYHTFYSNKNEEGLEFVILEKPFIDPGQMDVFGKG